MDQKEAKCQICQNHQFHHITCNVKYMFMLISFFLQTITQKNENHYQGNKSMLKVSNKVTIKRCRSSGSKVFLKIAVPKILKSMKNICKRVHL